MKIVVKKFGGTSVGSLERIRVVAGKILRAQKNGERCVVVVSAMQGETDRLLDLAYQLNPSPQARELAALVTTGEQVSMSLLAILLNQQGVIAKSYEASQLPIQTDAAHDKARIQHIHTQKILQDLSENKIVIIAGFQGIAENGDITMLGRGGSDTSAVALACALKAHECQIFTDVDGIYTADPRLVPKAYRQDKIPFKAMLELASLGSKVLQWRSVALAGKYRVPLRVLSSFKEGEGTLMRYEEKGLESPQFSGLSHQLQLIRFVLSFEHPKSTEFAQVAAYLSQHHILIAHLNQLYLEGQVKITVVVAREDQPNTEKLLAEFCKTHHGKLHQEKGLARISLVGIGLQSYPGVVAKFLNCFHTLNISPEEIAFSELSLSAILSEAKLAEVAQALHQTFFEP